MAWPVLYWQASDAALYPGSNEHAKRIADAASPAARSAANLRGPIVDRDRLGSHLLVVSEGGRVLQEAEIHDSHGEGLGSGKSQKKGLRQSLLLCRLVAHSWHAFQV